MKHYLFALAFLILVIEAKAQTPPRTDGQVLKAISERMGVDISSTEYFKTAPPEISWKAFSYLVGNAQYGNLDLAKRTGRAIAENAAVEKYVSGGLGALPHNFNNGGERGRLLGPLGYVPAPWSLRLLGHYLNDETPMAIPAELPDYGVSTNLALAIVALQQMGFSDAPLEDRRHGLTPVVEKSWHEWWKANENRVDERIREINPGYRLPEPVTSAIITKPSAKPMASASIPEPTLPPAASPSPMPIVQAKASSTSFPIAALVILIGILAGLVVFFVRRK